MKRLLYGLLFLFLPSLGFCGNLTIGGSGGGNLTISANLNNTFTVYPATSTASFPFSLTVTSMTVSSNTILSGATFYRSGPVIIGSSVTLGSAGNSVNISSNVIFANTTFYQDGTIRGGTAGKTDALSGKWIFGSAGDTVQVSSNTILPGATFYQNGTDVRQSTTTFGGNISFNTGSGVTGSDGTTAAGVGQYGESYSSCTLTSARATPSNGAYINLASIAIGAGDWDARGMECLSLNGATMTSWAVAVSTFSTTTTTDQIPGLNSTNNNIPAPTATGDTCFTIPPYPILTSTSKTVYAKVLVNFSAGTPMAYGCVSVRRMR